MKLQRIAFGCDFSPESGEALGHAIVLARRTGALLSLIHISPLAVLRPESGVARRYRDVTAREHEHATSELMKLKEQCSKAGVEVEAELRRGTPETDLARAAADLNADVLLIGTHGRTGLKRFMLGSVAERTVRMSDTAVLVARGAAPADEGYKRILVAVDFSVVSQRALQAAINLSAPQAKIEALHCWEVPAPISSGEMSGVSLIEPLRQEARQQAMEEGAKLLASVDHEGRKLEFVERMRPAAHGLQEALEENAYELAILGSHGHTGLKRLLLGSVAETTVRHSPCSVLVIKGSHALE